MRTGDLRFQRGNTSIVGPFLSSTFAILMWPKTLCFPGFLILPLAF
jgi:hypothetical protein